MGASCSGFSEKAAVHAGLQGAVLIPPSPPVRPKSPYERGFLHFSTHISTPFAFYCDLRYNSPVALAYLRSLTERHVCMPRISELWQPRITSRPNQATRHQCLVGKMIRRRRETRATLMILVRSFRLESLSHPLQRGQKDDFRYCCPADRR